MASIDKRRVEFGDLLRSAHERAGMNGKELAARLGWQASKVSRIENARQTPTDYDVQAWLAECGSSADEIERACDELRTIRVEYDSWQRRLKHGLAPRQKQSVNLEGDARSILMVEISAVPGLVQTSEYARNVFEIVADLHGTERDIDQAVAARMERQRVLYDRTKTFEILLVEAALVYPICAPADMVAQIDRLMSIASLPNVRFGVIPLNTRLPAVPMHGYWIVDDLVMVETVAGEITTPEPDEVDLYRKLTSRLWSVAAEGADARTVLLERSRYWAVLESPVPAQTGVVGTDRPTDPRPGS